MSEIKEKLKQLKELHDMGLISDDDFKREKTAILATLRGKTGDSPDPVNLEGQTRTVGSDASKETDEDSLLGATIAVHRPASAGTPDLLGGTRVVRGANSTGGPVEHNLSGQTVAHRDSSNKDEPAGILRPGTVFDDRYSIVSVLGKGGMGTVYQAVDTRLNQTVALKTLRPEVARDPDMVQLLSQEVALAQRLNHPNLLGIRHLEVKASAPYVVMELMDGGDLDELLASQGGRLATGEALRLMGQVLSGLSALHQERIAHLDVKPQNVLLSNGGLAKLADFGISSRLRDQRGDKLVAGTPEYSPPEQLAGQPCDVRADVYASGIMLYKLLAGRFPFEPSEGMTAVRAWHSSGARHFPAIDIALGKVVAKATAVDPNNRYRTAAELAEALNQAVNRRPWFPIASTNWNASAPSLHDYIRLPDGSFWPCADPASVLRQRIGWPGGLLLSGEVVLDSDPLALIYADMAGPEDFDDEHLTAEVIQSLMSGDGREIMTLPTQGPECDASLAVAAFLVGKSELAIRRMTMAKSAAKTIPDRLCIVRALVTGLGDVAEARAMLRDVATALQSESDLLYCVDNLLEIARIWHWLIDEPMRAEETLLQVEQILGSQTDSGASKTEMGLAANQDWRFEAALAYVQTVIVIRGGDCRDHDNPVAKILSKHVELGRTRHPMDSVRLLDNLGGLWTANLEEELQVILDWSLNQAHEYSVAAGLVGPEAPLNSVDVGPYVDLVEECVLVAEQNAKNQEFNLPPIPNLASMSEHLNTAITVQGYREAVLDLCWQLESERQQSHAKMIEQRELSEALESRKSQGMKQRPSVAMNPPSDLFVPPPEPGFPMNPTTLSRYVLAWTQMETRVKSYTAMWEHQQKVLQETGRLFEFSSFSLNEQGVSEFEYSTIFQVEAAWEIDQAFLRGRWFLCLRPKAPYQADDVIKYKRRIKRRQFGVILLLLVAAAAIVTPGYLAAMKQAPQSCDEKYAECLNTKHEPSDDKQLNTKHGPSDKSECKSEYLECKGIRRDKDKDKDDDDDDDDMRDRDDNDSKDKDDDDSKDKDDDMRDHEYGGDAAKTPSK